MNQPGRKYSAGSGYRYGFNGQEKDKELNENTTSALHWEYDSRINRRWNIDPVSKEFESPYLCFKGNPIRLCDPLGLEGTDWVGKKTKDGKAYTPEWRPDVNKHSKLKEGDVYIGNDRIIHATDDKYYHLKSDGYAYKIAHPTKKQMAEAVSLLEETTPPKKGTNNIDEKPGSPQGDEKSPNTDNSESEPRQNPPGVGVGGTIPEYMAFNVSSAMQLPKGILPEKANIPFTGSLSVTNDRYGNVYITPLNVTGTNSASTKPQISIMYYFMLTPSHPSEQRLSSFLKGTSISISGGRVVGGTIVTNETLKDWAYGIGYTSPGFNVTASHQPASMVFEHVGFKW